MGDSKLARRKCWPVRTYRLGTEPNDDLSSITTVEERVEMMWPLAVEAWSLAGLPMPQYGRSETLVRILRRPTHRASETIA